MKRFLRVAMLLTATICLFSCRKTDRAEPESNYMTVNGSRHAVTNALYFVEYHDTEADITTYCMILEDEEGNGCDIGATENLFGRKIDLTTRLSSGYADAELWATSGEQYFSFYEGDSRADGVKSGSFMVDRNGQLFTVDIRAIYEDGTPMEVQWKGKPTMITVEWD